jgi:WD repeat-containing protein 81
LCEQYELSATVSGSLSSADNKMDKTPVNDSCRGDSVSVEGNKLVMHHPPSLSSSVGSNSSSHLSQQISSDASVNSLRHLRGNWLAYWEHEVGRSDRDTAFRFQQISLQKFTGHTGSVRALCVLDNENSFISAGKDRTVRLWSLRNCSDGSASVSCQWTFSHHKKPVLAIGFVESVRLMASTDGSLSIWDPFTPCNIRVISLSKMVNSPGASLSHVIPLPAPSCSLVTAANTDNVLRFVDVRTGNFTHELRTTAAQAGSIHSMAVSPDGHMVAVGYTTGYMSTVDIRTGMLLTSWKAHDADILDVKAVDSRRIVTSSIDQTVAVWRPDDGKMLASLKGCSDAVYCMCVYKDMLIAASTTNRISVYSSLDATAELTSTKLKSDVVRGTLSSIAVLPLNRLLLMGTDSGTINLLA